MPSFVQFSRVQRLMKTPPVLLRRNAVYQTLAIFAVCCAMLATNPPVRGDETNNIASAKSDLFDKPLQELMQIHSQLQNAHLNPLKKPPLPFPF